MITGHCSTCGREVIWAVSPTGARLPLDARAVTVYCLSDRDPPDAMEVICETPIGDLANKVYVSHFLTCPQASQHSRQNKP